jgi:ribosomal protein S18 acetylase RimI-like enzyme
MNPATDAIRIRSARHGDLPALTGLLMDLFSIERDFQSAADPRRQGRGLGQMIARGPLRRVWVAVCGRTVVGMCTAQVVISTAMGGPAAIIEDVVVNSAFRRRGIGRKLMAAVLAWAQRRGLTRLQLLADRTNLSALRFYKTLGWKKTRMICLQNHIGPLGART